MHIAKRAYECYANTRDKAMLAVKLDAHGEVGMNVLLKQSAKLRSDELAIKY